MKKLFRFLVNHFEKRPVLETFLILGTILLALAFILRDDILSRAFVKYLIELTK